MSRRKPASSPRYAISTALSNYKRIPKTNKTLNQVKRAIKKHDDRAKKDNNAPKQDKAKGDEVVRAIPQAPSNMFFAANTALGPPYHVLVDTNFVSHSIRAKTDMLKSMMDL